MDNFYIIIDKKQIKGLFQARKGEYISDKDF